MCNQILFKWWCHLYYQPNNNQCNLYIANLKVKPLKIFPKPLNKMLRYWIQMVPVWAKFTFVKVVALLVLSGKILQDCLTIKNLISDHLKNFLFRNNITEFLNSTLWSLCVVKLVATLSLSARIIMDIQ